jgi:glucose uptake protein GlcU
VPALESLSIDDSAFRPLTRSTSPDDAAYALGEATGRLVVPVLVIAAVVVGLIRLRRKRARRWWFAVAIAIVCVVAVLGLLVVR